MDALRCRRICLDPPQRRQRYGCGDGISATVGLTSRKGYFFRWERRRVNALEYAVDRVITFFGDADKLCTFRQSSAKNQSRGELFLGGIARRHLTVRDTILNKYAGFCERKPSGIACWLPIAKEWIFLMNICIQS